MGRRALKFREPGDALISLRILGDAEEVLLVSKQGVIVRLQADQISQQSRAATGVRLQKLGAEDRLVEVVLVPPASEDEEQDNGKQDTIEVEPLALVVEPEVDP